MGSRYLLCVSIVADQSDACVRRVMTGLFKIRGLPLVIRVDNGAPFAGKGSLNLSCLSVWWLRLESWNIHMGGLLIGTLHQADGSGSMRAANFSQA